MIKNETLFQLVTKLVTLALAIQLGAISSARALDSQLPPLLKTANSGEPAPQLNTVANIEVNPFQLKRNYDLRNGFTIGELLSYIERLYPGRQFHSASSEFRLNKSQFGIAITDIIVPDDVEAYLSIGGNQFLYALYQSQNSDLARLLEPHQRISFRSFTQSVADAGFEVKIKFRLWDLREREQISPFKWYRLDQVGSNSPFSYQEQEVTFKVTKNIPPQTRPHWTHQGATLKTYRLAKDTDLEFVISIKDILSDAYGESSLRHRDNQRLGLRFIDWNNSIGKFYYRYDKAGDWTELMGGTTFLYLTLQAEIKIEMDTNTLEHRNTLSFYGWDGVTFNDLSLAKELKHIKFIQKED